MYIGLSVIMLTVFFVFVLIIKNYDVIVLPQKNMTNPSEIFAGTIDGNSIVFEQKEYTKYRLEINGKVSEGELNTERGFGDDIDATIYVLNWNKP